MKYGEIIIEDIFEVYGSKTTPFNELGFKTETAVEYPYVTTKSTNNGIDGFFNFFTEEGNVITVDSATNGQIHYQFINFSASDHVEILKPKFKCNLYIGLFLKTAILVAIKGKYNYGYKCSQKRIKNQIIILPITDENNPDFEYMERYMKSKEKELIQKYQDYINMKSLSGGENID